MPSVTDCVLASREDIHHGGHGEAQRNVNAFVNVSPTLLPQTATYPRIAMHVKRPTSAVGVQEEVNEK